MVNIVALNSGPVNGEEEVIFNPISGSGALITIEQNVQIVASGGLIFIEQHVVQTAVTHLDRTGWDLILSVGGLTIPPEQIHGGISVVRTESAAALMECTLITPAGIQNLDAYAGQSVILNIRTVDGIFRLFTGIVDIPEVNIIEKKITLRCTDKRTEQINSQLGGVVSNLGYFSPLVFPNVEDVAQEAEFRLTTIPYALDFDAYGNYTITPWAAKATPDFTLYADDVYYDEPRVEFNSRGNVTNQVSINVGYRFERLYNMDRGFQWQSPIASDVGKLLLDGYSMTFREMVRSAAEAAGWPIRGNITYTPIWPSGWYTVSGITVAFSTLQYQFENVAQTDVFGDPVLDANGNQVYATERVGGTDYAELYCMGASWRATTRWAQTVSESYDLVVRAPQSQTQYGIISQDTAIGVSADFDSSEWEKYTAYNDTGNGTGSYYINKDVNRVELNNAVLVCLNRAKTTILDSHRDTRVIVDTKIWPQVDLKHTVRVDTTPLLAKGKVYSIRHDLNIGTGEARTRTTLVLSRMTISPGSESSLSPPSAPADVPIIPTGSIILKNHFGQDPQTTPNSAGWTGMIGNRWVLENNNKYRTTIQEQFIVDVPAIPDNIRTNKNLAAAATYNIVIPNDQLQVTF